MSTVAIAIVICIALAVSAAFVACCVAYFRPRDDDAAAAIKDWSPGSDDAGAMKNYLDPKLWTPRK